MKNTIKYVLTLAAAAGALSLAAVSNVSAHGIAPSTGYGNMSGVSCFTVSAGTVSNICSGYQNWEVPLMVDSGGTKGATYGGRDVSCQLIASSQTGGSPSYSNFTAIGSTTGTASTSTVVVPTAGRMVLDCSVAPLGSLTNVNYSN